MSYAKGTCAECRQSVMLSDGLALDHKRRATGKPCGGSGVLGHEREPCPALPVENVSSAKQTHARPISASNLAPSVDAPALRMRIE